MVNLSCRAALRKGRPLTMAQARDLLAQLAQHRPPATCPHGSPIIFHLDEAMLEGSSAGEARGVRVKRSKFNVQGYGLKV